MQAGRMGSGPHDTRPNPAQIPQTEADLGAISTAALCKWRLARVYGGFGAGLEPPRPCYSTSMEPFTCTLTTLLPPSVGGATSADLGAAITLKRMGCGGPL